MNLRKKVFEILLFRYQHYTLIEKIADELRVPENFVNSIIEELIDNGIKIVEHPSYGVKLNGLYELSNAQKYIGYIDTMIKFNIVYFKTCSSTQDIAHELARKRAPEGTVVIADRMDTGRGRLGRKWYADEGGLWMSLILRPTKTNNLQILTLTAGVSVAEAIREITNLPVKLKWPNDVTLLGKKVSGILIDTVIEGEKDLFSIVGIGVNVNNNIAEELKTVAISLKDVNGSEIPLIPLLVTILRKIDKYYKYLMDCNIKAILEKWKMYSETIGRYVTVTGTHETIIGKAIDIDLDGALIVETCSGDLKRVYEGDVINLRFADVK